MRYTPDRITSLKKDEIFVFGSNESGIHAGGAARIAKANFGAEEGVSEGLTGKTYAIPTVNKYMSGTLTLDEIKEYVERFIDFAARNKNYTFLVTEIGCGIAGLKYSEVGPLFRDALGHDNIVLPENFVKEIKN